MKGTGVYGSFQISNRQGGMSREAIGSYYSPSAFQSANPCARAERPDDGQSSGLLRNLGVLLHQSYSWRQSDSAFQPMLALFPWANPESSKKGRSRKLDRRGADKKHVFAPLGLLRGLCASARSTVKLSKRQLLNQRAAYPLPSQSRRAERGVCGQVRDRSQPTKWFPAD